VVIPKGLRETVMTMAHDAVMSGYQGQKRRKTEFGDNIGDQDLERK